MKKAENKKKSVMSHVVFHLFLLPLRNLMTIRIMDSFLVIFRQFLLFLNSFFNFSRFKSRQKLLISQHGVQKSAVSVRLGDSRRNTARRCRNSSSHWGSHWWNCQSTGCCGEFERKIEVFWTKNGISDGKMPVFWIFFQKNIV